jgi:hypothetical protein
MKVYTVRILDTVFADIGDIADYIVAVSTPEHTATRLYSSILHLKLI